MKRTFTVAIDIPKGAGVREAKEYIDMAIRSSCGCLHPEDPMRALRRSSVVVKRPYNRVSKGRPKIKVKAPKKQYRRFPDVSVLEQVPNKPSVFL